MTRYVFANGKVTVEDGAPERPRRDHPKRGVLILAREVLGQPKPEADEQNKGDNDESNE